MMRTALLLALALGANGLPAAKSHLRGPREDDSGIVPLTTTADDPITTKGAISLPLPSDDERRRLSASSCQYFQLSGARAASLNGMYASDGTVGTCNGQPQYKLSTSDHWLYSTATDHWAVGTTGCDTTAAVLKLYGRAPGVAPDSGVIRLNSYSYTDPVQSYYSEQSPPCLAAGQAHAVNLNLPSIWSSTVMLQAWACASPWNPKATMSVTLGNYGLAERSDSKAWLEIRMEGSSVRFLGKCYKGTTMVWQQVVDKQPANAPPKHFYLPNECVGADRVEISCGGHCGVCRIAQLQVTARTGWMEDNGTWQPNCDVSTKCAWKARLGGSNRNSIYEGRVEVEKNQGEWGTVCDDNWDINDAHVACRQIFGQPAEARFRNAHFGEGNGLRIWMDDVHCSGSESALSICPFNPDAESEGWWDLTYCKHHEDAGVRCQMCDVGSFAKALVSPSLQEYECTVCDAGKASNAGRDACVDCPAGTVSAAGQGSCDTCGPGLFSGAGQASPCTKCGDDPTIWDQSWWDPNQQGLTNKDDCLCKDGRTGANCELEECAATNPVVSLGFLLLEAQWPRHERTNSRNEDFSAISGAFRNFDADGNNYLSVDEAQRGIADGGIAVPRDVRHIWSRELASGAFVKIFADATACAADAACSFEGQYCPPTASGSSGDGYCCQGLRWKPGKSCQRDVTITDMVNDELARLAAQGTIEFHERRAGSGDIVEMKSTYPSRLMSNETCAAKSTKLPKLDWTLDRQGKRIFKQCAYFNGEGLTREEGLADSVVSGGECNDVEGESIGRKCSYEFELPPNYVVTSYHQNDCVEPGTSTYDGRTLHCIELPSGELVDVLEVENAPTTCKVSDANACPAGYNIWVPRNYEHARAVREAVDPKFTYLVGVYGTASSYVYPSTPTYPMESNSTGAIEAGWTSVAGKGSPWFLRNTTYGQPDGNYQAGCWLTTKWGSGWTDGAGFLFDDNNCAYCHNNYLCSRNGVEVLDISTHSYCVETKFCPGGVNCSSATADPTLTAMRCTTGLQYDGTVWDVFPRMLGRLGISLQWLDTRYRDTSGFRVYKANTPFEADTSALLLREFVVRKAQCGLTFKPLEFLDLTTGSEPGFDVGYAVVPMNKYFDEVKSEAGSSGFIVPWFGDIRVNVVAKGGGPVKNVTVKVSHLLSDGTIDPAYIDFAVAATDDFGDALLPVRVHDRKWSDLSQHFRVTVEKNSTKANGDQLVHTFEPPSEDAEVRHLGEGNLRFVDNTAVSITGTVSHDRFGAQWFDYDCPHKMSDDATCMCPVDGVEVILTRASGAIEEVTVNDGKFSTSAFQGERVTLGLRMYNGSATGTVPHNFSVSHDAGANATTSDGQEPTFTYTADEDAVVEFLDLSTQRLAATLVVGAGGPAAEYVTGMPVVARSKRCGWQKWQWVFKGATEFVLGAATAFDVRTLGVDEVTVGKFYYPPRNENPDLLAASCDTTTRADVVDGEATIRGCRATIPVVETCDPSAPVPKCQTTERPCATMDGYTYVDQLPKNRDFERDLSILGTAGTNSTNSTNSSSAAVNHQVDFVVTSPLCLASVSAAAAKGTTLQSLLELSGPRENAYKLSPQENLLLSPPTDFTPPSDSDLYGTTCLADTDAVFREGDAVDFNFTLVEREPQCFAAGVWPWDAGNLCSGYKDTRVTGEPISIQIDDGLSGIQATAAYDEDPYVHAMIAAAPNPFAPFTHAMSLKFTRAFDGSAITFLRHAMLLGSIPEEVPQVWTVATNPTLIFMIIRDPPGGLSTTTLVEGSTISTSMAIDGAHAAELAETYDAGFGAGAEADLTTGVCFGGLASTKILGVGGNAGISYSHASPDVTVNRASSRHFDVSMSFSIGITTSNEEDLAGQPSDLIIGGGANLRFISSVEVYATASTGGQLCVHGRDTKQFLPEQVTTYVMSVYEIEQTMERLGAALRNPNATKLENVNASSLYDPKADIELQIKNWQTVLADYRKVTAQDATSIADVLEEQLNALHEAIAGKEPNTGFLYEAEANGLTTFSRFLDSGLDALESQSLIYHRHRDMGLPDAAKAEGADMEEIQNKEKKASLNRHRMKLFEKDVKDRVIKAGARCVDAVGLVEPGRQAPLCKVYDDIRAKIDLKHTLMNLCDHETGLASVQAFCERDHYRLGNTDPEKIIGAFGAVANTTEFITFSGGTALNLRWTIGEARGEGLKSKHSASVADSLSGSLHLGGQVGRRLLNDGDPGDALAGYAYPTAGRHSVLAVSKKLLEVAPEALERRRLRERSEAFSGEAEYMAKMAASSMSSGSSTPGSKYKGSKCRRRLGDEELSAEERRLGITFCGDFSGTESMSFDVELSRAASRNSGQTQEVVVHLKDDNPQDVFAVQIAMDPVHGTPIFTTLGGRSSCPGETGTTKRDSRVTLEDIKHLCRSDGEKCDGPLKCRCDDEAKPLAPGEPAIFSAIVQNLSPWQTEVMFMIRAVKTVTAWDAGKDSRVNKDAWDGKCPDGDPGSLSIKTLDMMNLRAPGGATITPLPYGQYELRFEVKRPDFEPQCSIFTNIELELVPMCERIHGGDPHSIYIYRTSEMDDKGNVKVVHPQWDNSTYDFTPATKALGYASSKKSFSVAWSRDVKGCKYADASNYNPSATVDDLSCVFEIKGCPYAEAANYDPRATKDDGSCVFSKMTKKFQSLACDADEHIGRKYSSACRFLRLSTGAVFSNGLTSKWAKNWASPQKCAQQGKRKDSTGKLMFVTQWCPAAPFECTVPNSCLVLDNNFGVVQSKIWGYGKSKSTCLAKADAAGRFVVKWCPEHLADFATDSPTPRPAASTTTAT